MIKGSKVKCINGKFSAAVAQAYQELPREGYVYTVRDFFAGKTDIKGTDCTVGILLDEVKNQGDPEKGFNIARFVPVTEKELLEADEFTKEVDFQYYLETH